MKGERMLKMIDKQEATSAWNKAVVLVACAALLLCFAAGTTFAYLWDKSDTYVNTFVAELSPDPLEDAGFIVKGEKVLEGRSWTEGDSFEFQLERYAGKDDQGASTWEKVNENAKQAVVYEPGAEGFDSESFHEFDFADSIDELEFAQEGDYLFRVIEIEGSLPGMSYVKDPVEFTAHVAESDDGSRLELKGVTLHDGTIQGVKLEKNDESGLYEIPASFLNVYSVTGSAQIGIDIVKSIEDESVAEPEQSKQSLAGFQFALFEADNKFDVSEYASPVSIDVTNAAGEATIRVDYDPADAGKSYRYVLRELVPTVDTADDDGVPVPGMTYDVEDRYLQVDVFDRSSTLMAFVTEYVAVEDEDGKVSFKPRELEDGNAVSDELSLEFVNVYEPAKASYALSGTKKLEGRDLVAGEFSFMVYESAAGFPDLAAEAQPVLAATNAADGAIKFGSLEFAQVGAYYYQVVEDASNPIESVEYDATRYGVAITVSDTGEGVLQANAVVSRIGDHVMIDAVSFANKYTAPGGDPENPEDPDQPGGSQNAGTPAEDGTSGGGTPEGGGVAGAQTGDNLGGMLLLAVAALAASGAIILLVTARKFRR